MSRRNVLITVVSAAVSGLLLGLLSPGTSGANPSVDGKRGSYIVVLRDDTPDPVSVGDDHASRFGVERSMSYGAALRGYAATIPLSKVGELRADPRVAFVSEDRKVQATAKTPPAGTTAVQTLPTGINRIDADLSSSVAGNGGGDVNVGVAVIDTGVGPHSDIDIKGGKNCNGSGSSYADGNGHGTHVAGTIGAKDDSVGVVGVAPGADIYAVRVLNNQGSGSWSNVICGVDWVTASASFIKVANMSLAGGGSDDGNCGNTNSDALHKAICASVTAGVTYVVAAGNENANFASSVPAAYNEVLTVTATADFDGFAGGGAAATCRTDVDDTVADFSNYTTVGSADESHTIAAPGVCIYSTYMTRSGRKMVATYATISGTSMASPHVAGAAALCVVGPCAVLTPAGVAEKLRGDAALQDPSYGFGGDPNSPIGDRYYGYLVEADTY